jgi:hypothetical protein
VQSRGKSQFSFFFLQLFWSYPSVLLITILSRFAKAFCFRMILHHTFRETQIFHIRSWLCLCFELSCSFSRYRYYMLLWSISYDLASNVQLSLFRKALLSFCVLFANSFCPKCFLKRNIYSLEVFARFFTHFHFVNALPFYICCPPKGTLISFLEVNRLFCL